MKGCRFHLCPPRYPAALHPFGCKHGGDMQIMVDARSINHRVELICPMCAACGTPLPGRGGGNVFVNISANYAKFVAIDGISSRLLYLRDRYGRVAAKLFGPDGWNGRHRKWAQLIDPNLTMRMQFADTGFDGFPVYRITVDEVYFAPPDEAEGVP